MELLTVDIQKAQSCLGISDLPYETVSNSNRFDTYPWHDQSSRQRPQIYRFSQNFSQWSCLIFETFAGSSQLERLKYCTGSTPILAIALDGSGFYGQHQRIWQTGLGNLYLSAYIPMNWLKTKLPQSIIENTHCLFEVLQKIPCMAVLKALEQTLTYKPDYIPGIKHPNDIVVKTKGRNYKLAGCLTEITMQQDKIQSVRMGIGLNIDHAPLLTTDTEYEAICCKDICINDHSDLYTQILRLIALNLITIDKETIESALC